jgi:mono/diheme cytochrome c family protein
MKFNAKRHTTLLIVGLSSFCTGASGQTIPITWDEAALASMQTPLRDASRTPKHMPSATYNRMPALVFYKTYPVYAPGREPAGYLDMLSHQEPETVFDPARLNSPEDWAKAGEAIFDAPTAFGAPASPQLGLQWYPAARVPVASDGTYPFIRYVIRKKGTVELGTNSCAECHTRVMPDGSVIKGAQGNYPLGRVNAESLRAQAKQGNAAEVMNRSKPLLRQFFAAPWINPDPYDVVVAMSLEEVIARISQNPPGVMTRDGATLNSPPQIPDLIGIRDRRYLDHTGTKLHRSIGDLMRYAALAQGAGLGSSWGDFRLVKELPTFLNRYTDESLYALAMYLYSLQPPANPHPLGEQARTGQAVFERAGCGGCHTAPLYTNNRLMAAAEIGTDPELAMRSRRGTGYYKVPSLKGLWYRGPFGHGGSSPTLEDWLDAARLTGQGTRKPSPGHEYGISLSPDEKVALIAFLRTL